MVDRIAIVKTGWSDWYQGGPVVGRFGYLNATEEGQKGHECYNFKPAQDGTYYGYLPPIGRGPPQPRMKDHWLLIFIAAFEGKGPLTFVGWYEDATFAEGYTERPEYRLSEPFETDAWGSRFFTASLQSGPIWFHWKSEQRPYRDITCGGLPSLMSGDKERPSRGGSR